MRRHLGGFDRRIWKMRKSTGLVVLSISPPICRNIKGVNNNGGDGGNLVAQSLHI
jgi:hypothetical protein